MRLSSSSRICAGRPTRRRRARPDSATTPRSMSSATRLETVVLLSPVSFASCARESARRSAMRRATRLRLDLRTARWSARLAGAEVRVERVHCGGATVPDRASVAGTRRRTVSRHAAARATTPPSKGNPHGPPQDQPRHLGLRLDGHALHARRLPAAAHERDDRGEGAPRRHGPRRPDRRLRVPLPGRALARQPRRGALGARRPRHLHALRRPAPRSALRPRRARQPRSRRRAPRRCG